MFVAGGKPGKWQNQATDIYQSTCTHTKTARGKTLNWEMGGLQNSNMDFLFLPKIIFASVPYYTGKCVFLET